jgi:hypothetical protein
MAFELDFLFIKRSDKEGILFWQKRKTMLIKGIRADG